MTRGRGRTSALAVADDTPVVSSPGTAEEHVAARPDRHNPAHPVLRSSTWLEPTTFARFKQLLVGERRSAADRTEELDRRPPERLYDLTRLLNLPEEQVARYVSRFLDLPFIQRIHSDDVAMGMLPRQVEMVTTMANRHQGTVLVVGPTGSGRSTTIFSLLSRVDGRTRSIMSVEDPVEYRIPFANQQQVNERAGVTFEALLGSAMRQGPDILFPGEIRDPFSAKASLDFASSGHPTVSTLHSPNATTAIFRLERSDINRPNLDGLKLIEMPTLKGVDVPLVFLTAESSSDVEAQVLQAGAADFIRKPISKPVLLGRL